MIVGFITDRARIGFAECRSNRFVEYFDVPKQIPASVAHPLVVLRVNQLYLELTKKRFHRRIVPTIAFTARARLDAVICQRLLVLTGTVLHPAIRMNVGSGHALPHNAFSSIVVFRAALCAIVIA